jgi:predicted secreted protein
MAGRIVSASEVYILTSVTGATVTSGLTNVGCASSVSLSVQGEAIDVTCRASGSWKEAVSGNKSWTAELSGIYKVYTSGETATNISAVNWFNMLTSGTSALIRVGSLTSGDPYWYGYGIIGDWGIDAGDSGSANYKVSITGNGQLYLAYNP